MHIFASRSSSAQHQNDHKIEPLLLSKLKSGQSPTIVISMTGLTTAEALERQGFPEKAYASRAVRLNGVTRFLKERANESQRDILNFLRNEQKNEGSMGLTLKQLWISNQIVLRGANLNLIRELSERSDVLSIEEDEIIFEDGPIPEKINVEVKKVPNANGTDELEWNIQIINVTQVWASGNKGEGVVVAIIDSGFRPSHESLSHAHRESYGWFDTINGRPTPYDDRGHGTHVMGSIVGTKGIGVAPNAKYIACKGLNENGSSAGSSIKECAQWILCPTDPKGENEDCSKAPNLVNNSWGGSTNGTHDAVISAWRAAGIIPIFSGGNTGRDGCNTAGYPGNSKMVISAAATASNDTVADFSSRGPTADGRIKPDIAAPGASILSASNSTDDGYVLKSGTSMASPHVAGLVTLILSEFGDLTFDQVKGLLIDGAVHLKPGEKGESCGQISQTEFPNNHIGFGRINATHSVLEAIPKWSFDCLSEGYFAYEANPRFYFYCERTALNQLTRRDHKCAKNETFNGQKCV